MEIGRSVRSSSSLPLLSPPLAKVAEDQLDPEARPMVFTRGRVDVSLLQHLLASKGDAVWTDEVCVTLQQQQ